MLKCQRGRCDLCLGVQSRTKCFLFWTEPGGRRGAGAPVGPYPRSAPPVADALVRLASRPAFVARRSFFRREQVVSQGTAGGDLPVHPRAARSLELGR